MAGPWGHFSFHRLEAHPAPGGLCGIAALRRGRARRWAGRPTGGLSGVRS